MMVQRRVGVPLITKNIGVVLGLTFRRDAGGRQASQLMSISPAGIEVLTLRRARITTAEPLQGISPRIKSFYILTRALHAS